MTKRRVVPCAVALCLLGMGAPSAFAAGTAKAPPRPVSGRWVIAQNGATNDVEASAGAFLVTAGAHRFVRDLHLTVGPSADTACGTGTIRVVGRHELLESTHTWVVGTKDKGGFRAEKVSVVEGGKTIHATLRMSFVGSHGGKHTTKQGGISGAQLDFATKTLGDCFLGFSYKAG